MKLKLLIGILIFLIALNLATIGGFVYTQWKLDSDTGLPAGRETMRRGTRGRGISPRFDPEKRQELRRLLDSLHEETTELRTQMNGLEENAFALLEQDPVPRDSLDVILEQLSGLRLEISKLAMNKLIEAKIHMDSRQQQMFFRMILGSRPDRRPGFYKQRMGKPHSGEGKQQRGKRI